MDNCIFCKLAKGEIPSEKLLETDKVFAFLDINPLSKGHFLVIPKEHAVKMHEVSDAALKDMLIAAKKIIKALAPENYDLLMQNGKLAGQEVMHAHLHVIPRTDSAGLRKSGWSSITVSKEELAKLAEQIRKKL